MGSVRLPLIGFVALASSLPGHTEMPPESQEAAPVAIVGRVESIDEWWDLFTDYYRIWVRVEKVERGQIQVGELVPISCFRCSRQLPQFVGMLGAEGHSAIPTRGDLIRVYAREHTNTMADTKGITQTIMT